MSRYRITRETRISREDGEGCATVIAGFLTVCFWLFVIAMVAKGCQSL
jgi:hypothetical protein